MKKKIVLVLAVAAAVLVLAIVVLLVVVDVDDFRGYIETRAEEALGRDVEFGRVGLAIVPVFGLEVDDVVVAARPGEGEGDLLTLRSLRIGARLKPLLQKRLEVTSIMLVEPSINLVRDSGGSWNFDLGAGEETPDGQEQTTEPDAAADVRIDVIRVTGGRVNIRDASRSQTQPLEVALTGLELEVSGIGSDELRVAVDSGELGVSDPAFGPDPLDLEIADVALTVRNGGELIELTNIELIVGKTTVVLAGTVEEQPAGRRIDIDLKPTTIAVADISSLLASAGDLDVSLTGRNPIEIEAGIHGLLAPNRLPEIGATAKLEGLTIRASNLTQSVTDVAAVATLRDTTLTVDGLRARIGDNDIAGTLSVVVQDRPTLEFALESQHADLGELLGLMAGGADEPSAPPDPDSFLVRGLADGTLKVAEGSWIKLQFRDLDARLRLENGVATLEPVSMELYDGRFAGRLASDLKQVPQSFEFSGAAENLDMNSFVADQIGKSNLLLGRFTGRVEGSGAGTDATTVIRSLEGQGVARIVDGQVGKLDVLRSVGQVAGVLGQQTLANLASESAVGATKFSQLAGDFRISGGALALDSALLESKAFDLTGTGTVDLLSAAMNGDFQIQFSPEVSRWMMEEGTRAAEVFWDSKSGQVVLPVGLSGSLDSVVASVDWGSAVEGLARRTVERELDNVLGNLLGGSSDEQPESRAGTTVRVRRAEAPSGKFAIELVETNWAGSPPAQDYRLRCRVIGKGVERALVKAVDASGGEVEKKTINVAARLAEADEPVFGARVNGEKLQKAKFPVTISVKAIAADGETARLVVKVESPGR